MSSVAFSWIFCENNCLSLTRETKFNWPIISLIFPSSTCCTFLAIYSAFWFRKWRAATWINSSLFGIRTFATASTSTLIKSDVGTLCALTSICINSSVNLSTLSKKGILKVAFPIIILGFLFSPEIIYTISGGHFI